MTIETALKINSVLDNLCFFRKKINVTNLNPEPAQSLIGPSADFGSGPFFPGKTTTPYNNVYIQILFNLVEEAQFNWLSLNLIRDNVLMFSETILSSNTKEC